MWWIILIIFISIYLYKQKDKLLISYEYLKIITNPNDSIEFQGTHIIITFYRNKIPYKVRLPFITRNKHKFYKMLLVKGDQEIDITHLPGIPYYLTAKDLGGDSIIKRLNDEDVFKFDLDEIPNI